MEEHSIKAIRQDFKKKGIFYTPPELALMLKSYVDIPYKTVYDPTCGRGNLLKVFENETEKYGQDIEAEEVKIAQSTLKNFHAEVGDTLEKPAFWGRQFDAIVFNPPFSLKWNPISDERFEKAPALAPKSKADYAFLLHVLHYLKHDGVAVGLNMPGILYRGNAEGKIRQWMVEKNYIDKVIQVPPKQFTDTNIATVILVLRKNKTTQDITFEDISLKKTRTVSFEEIKENGFNLSVQHYIQEEIVKEKIDTIQTEMDIREGTVRSLEASMELSLMIAELEGISIEPFLDKLEETIKNFREKIKTGQTPCE